MSKAKKSVMSSLPARRPLIFLLLVGLAMTGAALPFTPSRTEALRSKSTPGLRRAESLPSPYSPASQDTLFNRLDRNGNRHGHWRRYYVNGNRAWQAQFHHGAPCGLTRRYDQSGILRVSMQYDPDGHTVRVRYYDAKGLPIAHGNFFDKQRDSIWTYYSEDRLVRRESWNKGQRDGEFTLYSDQGHPAKRQNWKNGQQHGLQEEFYGNGKLRIRWNMQHDVRCGQIFTLFPNGLPRLVGYYDSDGERDSSWTLYDSYGKPEKTILYRHGERQNADSITELQTQWIEELLRNAGRIPEPAETMNQRVPYNDMHY